MPASGTNPCANAVDAIAKNEKANDREYYFFHKPKKLVPPVVPNTSERFIEAVALVPEDAVSEREALPCPSPVYRSVIELPVCAAILFTNH